MKEEIAKWREETGLSFIRSDEDDVLKKAIQLSAGQIRNADLADLDENLLVLSNYYTFLQSQLGMISARVELLQEDFSNELLLVASKYGATLAGERRALALSKKPELKVKLKVLQAEKSKLEMIRPAADGIRQKMYMLSKVYDRRSKSEY